MLASALAHGGFASSDSNATEDDGSCNYDISGCTDSTACNYDALANTDDGSCLAIVNGCTDATAFNYNALANTDDGSCIAELLGCTLAIPPAITAITLVALGTSVPDTFASVTAAQGSEYADSAVGNVTGSNSVNIFLGLGLPWVICA